MSPMGFLFCRSAMLTLILLFDGLIMLESVLILLPVVKVVEIIGSIGVDEVSIITDIVYLAENSGEKNEDKCDHCFFVFIGKCASH